jgi:hypothetical protein
MSTKIETPKRPDLGSGDSPRPTFLTDSDWIHVQLKEIVAQKENGPPKFDGPLRR